MLVAEVAFQARERFKINNLTNFRPLKLNLPDVVKEPSSF